MPDIPRKLTLPWVGLLSGRLGWHFDSRHDNMERCPGSRIAHDVAARSSARSRVDVPRPFGADGRSVGVQTNSDSGLAPTYSYSLLRAMPTNEAEWFGVSPMIAASTSAMFCDVLAEISTAPIQLAHSADVRCLGRDRAQA